MWKEHHSEAADAFVRAVWWRDRLGRSECDRSVDPLDPRADQLRGAGARAVQRHDSREYAVWSRGCE